MTASTGVDGALIDLSPYASYLLRRRVTYRALFGLVAAFFALLAVYVLALTPSGQAPQTTLDVIGGLSAAMAAISVYLTFRVELGDPITSFGIQPGFLEISLLSGKAARLPWNHPHFRLTFFDASHDPRSTPAEREMIIVRVDRIPPVYGGMTAREFGSMLTAAKDHGLSSTTTDETLGKPNAPTRVTVTVVHRAPLRAGSSPTAP